jgi:hypothetical protein
VSHGIPRLEGVRRTGLHMAYQFANGRGRAAQMIVHVHVHVHVHVSEHVHYCM